MRDDCRRGRFDAEGRTRQRGVYGKAPRRVMLVGNVETFTGGGMKMTNAKLSPELEEKLRRTKQIILDATAHYGGTHDDLGRIASEIGR